MRPAAGLLGVALALVYAAPASSVVITSDKGGQIGAYVARYSKVRQRGERVVIDGVCLSACTIVVGMIPPERLCATRNAVLGFHAAWFPDGEGGMRPSREATQVLMKFYPPSLRQWIARRGGLNSQLMLLQGRELAAYRPVLRRLRAGVAPGTRGPRQSSKAEPARADDDRRAAGRGSRHREIGIGPERLDQHARQPHFRRRHDGDEGGIIALRGRALPLGGKAGEEMHRAEMRRAERQSVQALQPGQQQRRRGRTPSPSSAGRRRALPRPIRSSGRTRTMIRPEAANSPISATTPIAHSAPMAGPSRPFAAHCRLAKPYSTAWLA